MEEQIKELTLLLLYLTSWTEKEPYGEYQRAWKESHIVIIPLYHPTAQVKREIQLKQYKKIWNFI